MRERTLSYASCLLIGCGNMGSAIAESLLLLKKPLFKSIQILDSHPEKCAPLKKLGAKILPSLSRTKIDANTFILLAVKPQSMEELLRTICPNLHPGTLLISIAAGVNLKRLQKYSGHSRVVRVMPNTPALVQKGASAWIASSEVTVAQKRATQRMLESFGMAIEVKRERDMDAVTALSGSGPAYVFYFLEALVQGATKLGLSEDTAQKLAIQTLIGGSELALRQAKTLPDLMALRAKVTSKGGTTERALGVFEKKQFKKIVEEALKAAFDRAQEL
ncbi:MAG: pyrroline-5-carboxylate reductase [Candidatus Gracilibacteria bacterium]